jgi:hypothetical protein
VTGCIFKRKLKSGVKWGHSFFAGRNELGNRIQVFKSGFETKDEAERECRAAIEEHEARSGKVIRDTDSRRSRAYAFILGDQRTGGFSTKCQRQITVTTEAVKQAELQNSRTP